uniref:Uncharacterized protein n=1 Tax=Oryza rufipogon TaxID=4529 RepID=A0A0E0Q015_ORYRU
MESESYPVSCCARACRIEPSSSRRRNETAAARKTTAPLVFEGACISAASASSLACDENRTERQIEGPKVNLFQCHHRTRPKTQHNHRFTLIVWDPPVRRTVPLRAALCFAAGKTSASASAAGEFAIRWPDRDRSSRRAEGAGSARRIRLRYGPNPRSSYVHKRASRRGKEDLEYRNDRGPANAYKVAKYYTKYIFILLALVLDVAAAKGTKINKANSGEPESTLSDLLGLHSEARERL